MTVESAGGAELNGLVCASRAEAGKHQLGVGLGFSCRVVEVYGLQTLYKISTADGGRNGTRMRA